MPRSTIDNTTIAAIRVKVSVRLTGFKGLDLLRGQRGYVLVNLTSTTQLFTVGRVYALHVHLTTIGFDGFRVQEARFKVGEIESCTPVTLPITLPPQPPQVPPSPTPFTWQLREYKYNSWWAADVRFSITTDNALRMESPLDERMGAGYAFRYLPRSLLDGNKIVVRLNAYLTSHNAEVGYVYVVDGVLLNRRDDSYIFVPHSGTIEPWRRVGLRDVRAIAVYMPLPFSGYQWFLTESDPLDLTGFQDWVTLVLAMFDVWYWHTVSIDWFWVAVVDPSDRTLVNFTFPYNTYTVVMEGGTWDGQNDYGVVAFNLTQIGGDYPWRRPPPWPWLEFKHVPPGYTVVVKDALGRVVASATSGSDGIARLNIWGHFVILDATVEVYDTRGVLRARVPIPDTIRLVGGRAYVLHMLIEPV
jgi:hypothetical protein